MLHVWYGLVRSDDEGISQITPQRESLFDTKS